MIKNIFRRITLIPQSSFSECGLCCLAMCCSFFGLNKPISYFRNKYNIGRDGLDIKKMLDIFFDHGLIGELYQTDDFCQYNFNRNIYIIHLRSLHYILLRKNIFGILKVYDPAKGIYCITPTQLQKISSGYFLQLKKTETFKKEKKIGIEFRHILSNIKSIFPILIATILLTFVSYLLSLQVPLIIKNFINSIIYTNAKEKTIFIESITVLAISFGVFTFLYTLFYMKLEEILYKKITKNTIQHILKMTYSYFDCHNTGDVLFRVNILKEIQSFISNSFIQILISGSATIVILFYFLLFYKILLLPLIITIVCISTFIYFINQYIISTKKRELKENEHMQNVITDMITNMFQIRCMNIHNYYERLFNITFERFIKAHKRYQTISMISNQLLSMIITFIPAYVLLYLALHLSETLSLGDYFAIYAITNTAFNQIITFIMNISSVHLLKTTIHYYNDLMDEKEIEFAQMDTSNIFYKLQVNDLSFKYSDSSPYILNNINFNIQSGEKIAIVGPSGSGKTTFIKLLMNLYSPSKGEINFVNQFGKIISAPVISVIPQVPLILHDSIRNNISLNDASIKEIDIINALKAVNLYDEIQKMPLKLETIISNNGGNLSGGQLQRIAIARELIKKPQLIILDESTSALDYQNEKLIYSNLKKRDITTLVISHRRSTIEDADRIYLFSEGTIINSGTHIDLLKKSKFYSDLFQYQ